MGNKRLILREDVIRAEIQETEAAITVAFEGLKIDATKARKQIRALIEQVGALRGELTREIGVV